MTKEIVCIVCPSSCRLTVCEQDGEITVTGNGCKHGLEHGKNEYANPMRMLTSTVAVRGGPLPRLPVISTGEVPKAKLADCLAAVYGMVANAPVRCGDILIKNVCGTGADVIASRTMDAVQEST